MKIESSERKRVEIKNGDTVSSVVECSDAHVRWLTAQLEEARAFGRKSLDAVANYSNLTSDMTKKIAQLEELVVDQNALIEFLNKKLTEMDFKN